MKMHEALLYLPHMSGVDPTHRYPCPHCKKPFVLAKGIVTTQAVRDGEACLGFFCSEACLLAFVPRGACGDA